MMQANGGKMRGVFSLHFRRPRVPREIAGSGRACGRSDLAGRSARRLSGRGDALDEDDGLADEPASPPT
jgi:hypothetical protein